LTQTIALNVLGHTAKADAIHANTRLALIGGDTRRKNANCPLGSVDAKNKNARQTPADQKSALSLIMYAISQTTAKRIRSVLRNNAVLAMILTATNHQTALAMAGCNALDLFLAVSMGLNAMLATLLLSCLLVSTTLVAWVA
jgi:hypothetical protein